MQWSVLLPVVLTLIATNNDNNRFVERISDLSYTKWALEAFVVSNAKRFEMTALLRIMRQFNEYTILIYFDFLQLSWCLADNKMWCTLLKRVRSQ